VRQRHAHCGPDAEVASACSSTVCGAAWTLELLERCPRMISRTVRTEHTFSGFRMVQYLLLQYCTPRCARGGPRLAGESRRSGGAGRAGRGDGEPLSAERERAAARRDTSLIEYHWYTSIKARPVLVHRCSDGATQRARQSPLTPLRFSMRRRQLKKPLLFLLWADRAAAGRAVGAACASPSVRLLTPVRPPTSVRPRLSVRPPPARSPSAASAVSADVDDSSARASASDKDWSSWSREADTCCAERSLSAEKRSE